MIALRANFEFPELIGGPHWGDKPRYLQRHAERARRYAEQVRERANHAPDSLSKRRILKLAKRYEKMANLAEEQVKNLDRII